ncbi:hypothetical protein Aple_021150 [Acrocarpospora pleiomorpha]|uniref:Glycosyltransferase RgtA/B/C/D-like domain-containing protein n=1 Tax=Acrocarpospora pleiomorpha TaxID=90975 RepID=A0A5M3XGF4_9ACTN|nr:hypothetical protein [Acrocarpospora pleiomorpha]GES19219.1 hypothetical protein Aple_021150 [Acrocarpospora pleiomorpha]
MTQTEIRPTVVAPAGSRLTVLVGVILVAVQLGWRTPGVLRSFFREDDFVLIVRAHEQDLGWSSLFTPLGGRLTPGGLLLAWFPARADAYDWTVVAITMLVVQALVSLAVLRMLVVVFGRRPAILGPFIIFLVTPLTLPVLTWWSASLSALVPQLAVAMAVTSHVLWERTGRRVHAIAAVSWVIAGALFSLSVAAVPVLLFVLSRVYLRRRRAPVLWTGYGFVVAVSVVVRLAASGWNAPDPATGVRFLWRLIGQTFATGLIGGPGRWYFGRPDHGIALPAPALVVAAWIVILIVVAVTVRARANAAAAWLMLLGYVLAAGALPALLGPVASVGEILGGQTELLAGTAPVVALCLGLATLGPDAWPRLPRLAAVVAIAGVVVLAVWSSSAYIGNIRTQPARDYLATAAAELARTPSSVQIYDTPVPRQLMSSWFGDYRMTSRVLGPLAGPDLRDAMRRPAPAADPMVFDRTGRLRPMTLTTVVAAAPASTPACYRLVAGRIDIPLAHDLPARKYTVAFSYTATRAALATFSLGGARVPITLDRGSGVRYLQATGGGPAVRISGITAGAGVCVSGIRIGSPAPRPQ